jgi:hypothetical protein
MPGIPRQGGDQDQPIPDMTLDCHKLTHSDAMGTYVYSVASGKTKADEKNRETGTEEWLKNAAAEIVKKSKGQFDPNIPLQAINAPPQQKGTGLQFGISLQKDKIQIVQLYVIDARIYYLAVLGDGINLNDEPVERFFKSFEILAKKK